MAEATGPPSQEFLSIPDYLAVLDAFFLNEARLILRLIPHTVWA